MHSFAYARPATLQETVGLLAEQGSEAAILAGGTDLVVALRNRTAQPRFVIDVKHVLQLPAVITTSGSHLTISATTVMAIVEGDERVRTRFPALAEAAATVGSVQIRNRATVVGNICHASPAADTAPALLAYGAEVNVASGSGVRRVPLTQFFVGPGRTVLEPCELVTSIDLPFAEQACGGAFVRITRRLGVDLATVGLCCVVTADGRSQFAYGAVGPTPFLIADDSGVLADVHAPQAARKEALHRLIAQARPISDVRASQEYREAMLLVMSWRALGAAIARLDGERSLSGRR